MSGIEKATAIKLTADERCELEGLARSGKSEHRIRQRAQIVLLAADGLATRAIARRVGCTTGTASKWRVRYAADRLAGLDETGDRGAVPKYTAETGRRILAVLDGSPPAGHGRWTAPLIATARGDVHEQYVWRFLRAQKIDLAGRKSWCVSHDPEFAAKAAEIVGLYLDPPEGALVVAVDEKPPRTRSGLSDTAERARRQRPGARLHAARHLDPVRRLQHRQWRGYSAPLQAPAPHRVPRFHEPRRGGPSRARDSCHPRQPQDPQTQARRVARPAQKCSLPFHADPRLLAQSGRVLVLDPRRPIPARSKLHWRRSAQETHRCVHRALQPNRPSLRLEQIRSPSETSQTAFRGPLILGTSPVPLSWRHLD